MMSDCSARQRVMGRLIVRLLEAGVFWDPCRNSSITLLLVTVAWAHLQNGDQAR